MKIKRLIIVFTFSISLTIIALILRKENKPSVEKQNIAIESLTSNNGPIQSTDNSLNRIEIEDSTVVNKSDRRKAVVNLKSQKGCFNKTNKSSRIIKGGSLEMKKGRRGYDLAGREINTKHFAVRVTTPDNPFRPHKHEQSELWFIIKGKAKVLLDGIEYEVEENDLIILDPWIEHGLNTNSQVTWICLC